MKIDNKDFPWWMPFWILIAGLFQILTEKKDKPKDGPNE